MLLYEMSFDFISFVCSSHQGMESTVQKDNNAKKGLFFWIRSSAWKRAGTVFLARKNLSLVFIQTVAFWAEIFNHFTIYHEYIPDVCIPNRNNKLTLARQGTA